MQKVIYMRAVRLFWAFVLVFLALIGHLAYIQLVSGERLARQAVSQQSQAVALEVPPRGQVFDRNLKPLTPYQETRRAIVFPAAARDKEREAWLLASVLGINYREARSYFDGSGEIVPYNLTGEQVSKLNNYRLPGVIVSEVSLRQRKPGLASHIIGFLGRGKGTEWDGKMGIELDYNSVLKGSSPGSVARVFLDAKGRLIPGLGYRIEESRADTSRKDVVLTININIQQAVEKAIDRAGIINGAVVVLDIATGDILAMASRPDYYLDNRSNGTAPQGSFLNHALITYPPGSVFKTVVAAAALEEGIVNPEDVFLCLGEKDDLVKCYKKEGHGLITFAQAVAYSCNPTFARVGLKLGAEKLVSYAEKLGLGNTGIIGYNQAAVDNRLENIARKYNLVNASLGQWPVKANVVQVTAMMSTVANDGIYRKPRLVKQVLNRDGTENLAIKQDPGVRVLSAEVSHKMQSMLESVTGFGTGQLAWVEQWGSAGKTGSAQVGSEQIDAWFSGYAPTDSPRYAVTVMVADGESGGSTAAPVFREIMEEILTVSPQF